MTQLDPIVEETLPCNPFDFVESCEPDCSPERHAYHQGQWDMAVGIAKHYGVLPNPIDADEIPAMTNQSELDKILKKFREACYKHGMEVGQEFPDVKPGEIHDPCNAEDQEEAKQAINTLIEKRLPEFAKPGGIIPYETIKGTKYVKLEWIEAQLKSLRDSSKGEENAKDS